jgi:hypothetical protein
MLSIETILMLMAGSITIIIITAGLWIYLLIRKENKEDDWRNYSDGDPKDDDPEYEKIMQEVREHAEKDKAKGAKTDFDDDVPI